jgi:hypothetical protein
MADLVTLIARARTLAQIPSGLLDPEDEVQAAREALARYSYDLPRLIVTDLTGDGATYAFTLPDPFDPESSLVMRVEYPANQRPSAYLDSAEWVLYRAPSGMVLRLERLIPGHGEVVRVTFTAPHTLDGLDGSAETTVPRSHEEALVLLLASRMLYRVANRFVHLTEPVLADVQVERQSRAIDARELAQEMERQYQAFVRAAGISAGVAARTGTVVHWDVPGSLVLTRWGQIT